MKGKIKPLAILEKNQYHLDAFASVGESVEVDENVSVAIESFVCTIYGYPMLKSVNETRFTLFKRHFSPKNESLLMEKIKGTDPSQLPPCQAVLLQKIK